MKSVVVVVLAFILLQSVSCVKKVTPSLESAYLNLDSTGMYLYNSAYGGTICKDISLDGDTTNDFGICSYYFGGGQAKQSIFYATADNGVLLELNPNNSGLAACRPGALPLHLRKAGETIVTADTSKVSKSATYYYYVGAGSHGTALLGNCSYSDFQNDSIFYIVLRKLEGSTLSIGYLEVKKNKLTRFRKFKKENKITLP